MVYPTNYIVLIGDRSDIGNNFATSLLLSNDGASSISHMCLLKGGIDVIKVE